MCQFVETIRIFNKNIYNIYYHNKRLNKTIYDNFQIKGNIDLANYISIPGNLTNGLYKCRIIYSDKILSIKFEKYKKRKINRLMIIRDEDINYSYKFLNREVINKLLQKKNDCDDILIIKNNYVTDTSFSNVVFWDGFNWITPSTFLLPGTRREFLLTEKKILKADIKIDNIKKYKKISLINSMLDIGDVELDIEDIIY